MYTIHKAFAWPCAFLWCVMSHVVQYSSSEAAEISRLASEAALENMFVKIERDTLRFAEKMEELLSFDSKCSTSVMDSCSGANYHGCDSELPQPQCPGKQYAVGDCGKGQEGGCGGVFDFTVSAIRIAPDENPSYVMTDEVRDGICSTLQAEEYMVAEWENQNEYWSSFNVESPPMFFGSNEGVFRMFPGTPVECSYGEFTYDPRVRPWYVGASSGPKDIILVLDTSSSMSNAGRLGIMIEAAKRVIETLNYADHFAVIEFNDYAERVGAGKETPLQRASARNKEEIINHINDINAGGTTNFRSGFEMAFDVLKYSEISEKSSNCHQAILFLTDGIMSDSKSDFFLFVEKEYSRLEDVGKSTPMLFTYSFGSGADIDVPKELACKYNGIWADIEDGGNLSETMGAYYKYFAFGLGSDADDKFVSWVEPYEFAEGTGFGTTASAPVYDRSVDPPILVGAVGLDFSFAAMEQAFGKDFEETKDAFISRIVETSVASCQSLDLTDCQMQSLRKFGSSDDANNRALCSDSDCYSASFIQPIKAKLCSDNGSGIEYPSNVWNNRNTKGIEYLARKCCSVGAEVVMTDDAVCYESNIMGLIVGLAIGGGVLFAICVALCIYCRRRKKKTDVPYNAHSVESSTVFAVPLPPPTAPSYQN